MTNTELKNAYIGGMSLLALAKKAEHSRDWVSRRLTIQGVKLRGMSEAATTHGQTGSRLYKVWSGMIERCESPTHHAWEHYGGRGIAVCKRWRRNFQAFADDMGPRPKGYCIDRIDNNLGYSPDNCRWVSKIVSTRNRRNSTMVEVDGATLQLNDACEKYGAVAYGTAKARIRIGWKPDVAVKTPKGTRPTDRFVEV